MSSAEFSLWLELYKRSPWDDTRLDIGFGIVASTIANYAGKMRPDGAPNISPAEFMPFLDKPKEETTVIEPDPLVFFGNL